MVVPRSIVPGMLDPATVAKRRDSAAVINGDFFADLPRGDAVPHGALVVDGHPIFIPPGWSPVTVWNPNARLRTTYIRLHAQITVGDTAVSVSALNFPLVSGTEIALMNADWGRATIPPGLVAVVVKRGVVVKTVPKAKAAKVPRNGFLLVARSAGVLAHVEVGAKASADISVEASDHRNILHAAGHGGVALKDGAPVPMCSPYERLLRPRSVLAWDDSGRTWFITSSSGAPDSADGLRRGGTTKEELARLAQQMGARSAVVLDGGGSTALFAKRGNAVKRLDMPEDSWVRPVSVVWEMVKAS